MSETGWVTGTCGDDGDGFAEIVDQARADIERDETETARIVSRQNGKGSAAAPPVFVLTLWSVPAGAFPVPAWLQSFDPEARAGRGAAKFTTDAALAMTFGTPAEAFEYWRQQSVTVPLRPDGEPNRPLTAFTMAVERRTP
jgi:hypothetical protein